MFAPHDRADTRNNSPDDTDMQSANDRTITDPLEDRATAALTMTTHRLQLPHRERAKHLHTVLADVRGLAATGCNESECRMYETAIGSLCDELFGGKSATCERTALRMELEADTQEDRAQGLAAIDGETPTTLDLHAQALDKQAVASRTLAGIRRRRAREIRESRTTALQRFAR